MFFLATADVFISVIWIAAVTHVFRVGVSANPTAEVCVIGLVDHASEPRREVERDEELADE
jgi:hypothetical protein